MCNFYFFSDYETILKSHGLHATVENNNKPEVAMKKTIEKSKTNEESIENKCEARGVRNSCQLIANEYLA